MEIPTDGTVSEITFCPAGVQRAEPFVQGMQRGGSSMLGLRGNRQRNDAELYDRASGRPAPEREPEI